MKFNNCEKVLLKKNVNNERINCPKKNLFFNLFSFIKYFYIILLVVFIVILFIKMKEEKINKTPISNKYINLEKYEIKIYNKINLLIKIIHFLFLKI